MAPYLPSQQRLYSFCESNNIILKNQDTLEAVRRANCKKSIIISFYNNNEGVLNRDSRLIWNVDETCSESKEIIYLKENEFLCTKDFNGMISFIMNDFFSFFFFIFLKIFFEMLILIPIEIFPKFLAFFYIRIQIDCELQKLIESYHQKCWMA